MFEIAVLVSAGRHPVSGRARRAPNDARALELALTLAEEYGARVRVLHAGDAGQPALPDYLGMGVTELHVLTTVAGDDIAVPLTDTLRRWQPDLILTGVRAETGWSGGCLPYVLAEALGYSLGSNIDHVAAGERGVMELRQVCARGRRRLLRTPAPAVVTVDPAAPAPRQSAFAKARRGRLVTELWTGTPAVRHDVGEPRPARRRPRRLRAAGSGVSAEQRLQALTGSAAGGSRLLKSGDAEEAALTIITYLAENNLTGLETLREK